MWTDWKIDVTMVDSMGDSLHNIMHSMGIDSVTGWKTVSYTGLALEACKIHPAFWVGQLDSFPGLSN